MFQYFFIIAFWAFLYKPIIAQTPTPTEPSPPFSNGTSTYNISTTPAPTWPTATFPTFPPQFSDIPAETLSCWESWANYLLRRSAPNPGLISSSRITTWVSTYPTISYSTYATHRTYVTSYTVIPIGLTTLCDGYPRAASASWKEEFGSSWWNVTYTLDTTYIHSTVPGVTKSGYEVVRPTCTVAPNGSPMCEKIHSAYYWWLTSQASASPTPIPVTKPQDGDLAVPTCWTVAKPPPDSKPTCRVYATSHEIYFWPTPRPTGADFCNSSWIAPTPTPTIPGKPNTQVVSGLTLTSPSIYHFFRDVVIQTFGGTKTRAAGGYIPSTNVWPTYTLPSNQSILTIPQLESDILSVTSFYNRKSRKYLYTFNHDFLVADVATVRAEKWYSYDGNRTRNERNSTIFQDQVQPYLAVAPQDLVRQNGLHELDDCVWAHQGRYVDTREPVYVIDTLSQSQFHPITTTEAAPALSTAQPGLISSRAAAAQATGV